MFYSTAVSFCLPLKYKSIHLKSSIPLSGILGFFKFSCEHRSTTVKTERTRTANEYRWSSYIVHAKTGGLEMNKTFTSIKGCCFASPTRTSSLPYENLINIDIFLLFNYWNKSLPFFTRKLLHFFSRILQSLNNQKRGTVNNKRN